MTPTHTSHFSVRYDECDMYGHVNHAVYLRYMQAAAFAASAAVGYGVERYEQMGCHWLVRETDVSYLAPLQYDDGVNVKTWVVDFRRVRSRRAYELRRAADDELVAQGTTDWVFLDSETLRPVSIPDEMAAAFLPDGPPAEAPEREPFPQAPPMPAGTFTIKRRVAWCDVDPTGHMNNAAYLNYLEDCAVRDAHSRGWSMKRMMEEGGFAIVARRFRIQYRQPALLDDELLISTWISDVRRASAVRNYALRRASDSALLTRAWAFWVWVDVESGRIRRIPGDFLADFADNIVLP